jgi:hypothetical protein
MSETSNNLANFFIEHAWTLVVSIVIFAFGYGTLSARVQAAEVKADTLQSLVERIIVLEEDNKHSLSDIQEIKSDVKEIKKLLK